MCIRTVDTDVVVLEIAMFEHINPEEFWIAFGTGSNFYYIPVHSIAAAMDSRACAVLHVFHAFTGCDTTSALAGRGKRLHSIQGSFFVRSWQHLKTYYTCKKILEMQLFQLYSVLYF